MDVKDKTKGTEEIKKNKEQKTRGRKMVTKKKRLKERQRVIKSIK